MKNSASGPFRHFIAINFHGFHEDCAALYCARSVHMSAKGLSGIAKIIFFDHSGKDAEKKLAVGLEALDIERISLPQSSNGENLNKQIARAEGYDFFYRVDADDLVFEDRFRWQADKLANSGCDICGGGLVYHNIKTGNEFPVLPPESPNTVSFLSNQYFMHPTLAFRLETLTIRYGENRLEDKELALSALQAGLTVYNDQRIYGIYHLNPMARSELRFTFRDLNLNLVFIRTAGSYWALPLAFCLFVLSLVISRNMLRGLRNILFSKTDETPQILTE